MGRRTHGKHANCISKVFGPLKDHPTRSTPRTADDEAVGVIDMHYVPSDDPYNDDGVVEIDGKRLARYSPWHFDHCYTDELNRAGVLRAPINAPEGGRTGFMDGIELYKQFPKDLRDKIEQLNIYPLETASRRCAWSDFQGARRSADGGAAEGIAFFLRHAPAV